MVRRHRDARAPRTTPLAQAPPTLQDLLPLLEAASISPAHIQQIAHRYGPAAPEVLRTHPYRLVRDIGGIPFQAVDAPWPGVWEEAKPTPSAYGPALGRFCSGLLRPATPVCPWPLPSKEPRPCYTCHPR